MISYETAQVRWKYRLWRRWHNLWCAECRGCYTFWTARAIPLSQQKNRRKAERS